MTVDYVIATAAVVGLAFLSVAGIGKATQYVAAHSVSKVSAYEGLFDTTFKPATFDAKFIKVGE